MTDKKKSICVKVLDPTISAFLQTKAFEAGLKWITGEATVSSTDKDYLVFKSSYSGLQKNMIFHSDSVYDDYEMKTIEEMVDFFEQLKIHNIIHADIALNIEYTATFETEGYVTVGCQKVLYKNWEAVNDTIQKIKESKND